MKIIKIAVIFLIIAVLISAGIFIYYKWFLPAKKTEPGGPANKNQPAVGLKILSDAPIFDYWFNADKKEITAISQKGEILTVQEETDQILNKQNIDNLYRLLPSPDGRQAIVAFGNPNHPQFTAYDIADNTWSPLPLEILKLQWLNDWPNADNLMALTEKPPFVALETFNLKNKNELSSFKNTIIKDIGLEDLEFNWISKSSVRFIEKPTHLYSGSLWSLDFKNQYFNKIAAEPGLIVKWHPDGLWGIKFSSPNNFFAIDNKGTILKKWNFATFPDKCAFKENSLFCFIPDFINPGWKLPDDYLQNEFYVKDGLFKLGLEKDNKIEEILKSSDLPIDAQKVKIINGQIYFINRYDQKLYSFPL